MKNNKQINSLIFEIVVLISTVVGTYFLWNTFDYDRVAKMAYEYSKYNNELLISVNSDDNLLVPYENSKVYTNNTIYVSVKNINTINKTYELFLRFDNEKSTLSKNYLLLDINNQVYHLSDLESFNKGIYTYYKITEDTINKKSVEEYEFNLFLEENTPTSEFDKILNLNFDVEEI